MPKTKKRKLGKAPSREEVAGFRETSDLFRSNLFRLQTAELLREVRPAHGLRALRRRGDAIRALREALLGVPAAELAYASGKKAPRVSHPELAALRLHGASVQLAFEAPAAIDLVGSYLLRTAARPALNVDLAVQIPSACLLEKDYLDHRYADKRQLYLAHLGATLVAGGHVRAARFTTLGAAGGDPGWPVLACELGGGDGMAARRCAGGRCGSSHRSPPTRSTRRS